MAARACSVLDTFFTSSLSENSSYKAASTAA
jgi:hypothetical protein